LDRPRFDRPRSDRPAFGRSGQDRGGVGQSRSDRPWEAAPRPAPSFRPALPPPDLLAENEELVAGRRPVEEAFVARRPAHRLLVVPQRRQALERLVLHATSLRIPVVEVEGGTLTALAGFDGHQGIALAVEPRVYAGIDDVLARAVERGEPPFVLVLDSLEDPQNVGTLLRSAEAAGVHGVIFPTHRQAPLTPAAIKASAGAVEHLLLCPVDDLPGAMSDLRVRGLRIAAAEADAPLTAAQADLRGPLAIIVGSEGQGLSPAVRRRADVAVRIPMRGAIGSLNASVAGSILLFAAVAQRDPAGIGDKPARPVGADAWPVRNEPPAEKGPQRKKSRGQSVVEAVTDATPADAATDVVAPAPPRRRTTKKAAAAETEASSPAKAPNLAKAPKKVRATRKAPATEPSATEAEASAKPARRRAATTTPKGATAAAADAAPSADELLPGGPDPA
jgi:23S rRNA (guanosine2251-2'-O)-methyltransferase